MFNDPEHTIWLVLRSGGFKKSTQAWSVALTVLALVAVLLSDRHHIGVHALLIPGPR